MAATTEQPAPAKGGGKMNLILLIVLAVVAVAAGATTPVFLMGSPAAKDRPKDDEKKAGQNKVFVTFGEVSVNLAEEKLTRYIKVKVILVVDAHHEKEVNDAIAKSKAILKNWLLSYMSDKSLTDVRGAAGQNRARREIQDHFNGLLFTDGSEKIRDVLFEDWLVQ